MRSLASPCLSFLIREMGAFLLQRVAARLKADSEVQTALRLWLLQPCPASDSHSLGRSEVQAKGTDGSHRHPSPGPCPS